MRRFLKYCVLFVLLVISFDLLFGFCMDRMRVNAKGGHNRKMEDIVRLEDTDILVMGSSRACHHYNPAQIADSTGLSVYNAGFEGNGVILMYGLLRMAEEHTSPCMVIYDVTPEYDIYIHSDDHNMRYVNFLKPYARNRGVREIIGQVSKREKIKLVSGLYRYNSHCLIVANDFLKGHSDPRRGFDPMFGKMETIPEPVDEISGQVVDPLKIKIFTELIQFTKENGIRLVVVASPKAGMHDSAVFSPLLKILEAKNIPFLDHYCDPVLSFNPSYFNDPVHLNEQGVSLFLDIIIDELRSQSLIPES